MRIPLYIALPDDEAQQQEIILPQSHLFPGQRYVIKTPSNGSLLFKATCGRRLVRINANAKYSIKPADVRQRLSLNALNDPDITMCVILGPSGTGKSCLSIAEGIKQVSEGKYDALIIVRALITVGKSIGWGTLPGGPSEKLTPYVQSVFDVADSINRTDQLINLEEEGRLEFVPVDVLRGRDFRNSYVIIEENQGLDDLGLLTACTRIGSGSKVVLNGDPNQCDLPRGDPGLYKLLGYNGFWHSPITYYMNLTKRMRSPICEIVEDAILGDNYLAPLVLVEDTVLNID